MSWAIWITGLPASGKSVLARAAAAELRAGGDAVVVLELGEIRKFLTPSPTYTDTERDVVYRALVYMATALTTSGTPVTIDATAHRRAWRDLDTGLGHRDDDVARRTVAVPSRLLVVVHRDEKLEERLSDLPLLPSPSSRRCQRVPRSRPSAAIATSADTARHVG